jgi:hypothetical protein
VMMRLLLSWLLLQSSAVYAVGQDSQQPQSQLIARHQLCVLETFVQNANNARGADQKLLDRSVEQCEPLLQPLKNSLIVRTGDPKFADSILEKIRRASKRGAAVALVGYLAKQN